MQFLPPPYRFLRLCSNTLSTTLTSLSVQESPPPSLSLSFSLRDASAMRKVRGSSVSSITARLLFTVHPKYRNISRDITRDPIIEFIPSRDREAIFPPLRRRKNVSFQIPGPGISFAIQLRDSQIHFRESRRLHDDPVSQGYGERTHGDLRALGND